MSGAPTRSARSIAIDADAAEPLLDTSYAECQRFAAAHYENFPVASWLLPRRMRRHVAAVYAFARQADDFADEGDLPAVERHRRLDDWETRLRTCVRGAAVDDTRASRVFLALGHTIETFDLPIRLFEDLLSAFRQDITTDRYETWEQLLDYCRRSANPVGRLVLRLAGIDDPAHDRASDALCTALQLTNFWQDLARDWGRGRLYVPAIDRLACGAREQDLSAGRWTSEWVRTMERAESRTRQLFERGRPVCDAVQGRLRLELRMTWLGATLVLDRLASSRFDVFASRPRLHALDAMPLLWRAATWRAA